MSALAGLPFPESCQGVVQSPKHDLFLPPDGYKWVTTYNNNRQEKESTVMTTVPCEACGYVVAEQTVDGTALVFPAALVKHKTTLNCRQCHRPQEWFPTRRVQARPVRQAGRLTMMPA
jgi:hypothetical protein